MKNASNFSIKRMLADAARVQIRAVGVRRHRHLCVRPPK
jgi:hypothetical protein